MIEFSKIWKRLHVKEHMNLQGKRNIIETKKDICYFWIDIQTFPHERRKYEKESNHKGHRIGSRCGGFDSIQIYQQQRICGRGDREKNCGSNQEVGLQAEQACPWVKDQLNKKYCTDCP